MIVRPAAWRARSAASEDVRTAAAWAADVGGQAGGRRLQASVAARVNLRFDDAAAGIDHSEVYECVFFPLTDKPQPAEAHVVDYDERDLRPEAPAGAVYVLPQAPIDRATYFTGIEKQLKDYLFRTRSVEVSVNSKLKVFSRVGETPEEFAQRCHGAAMEKADAEAATLKARYQAKVERMQAQQRTAEDRVRELTVDTHQRVQTEIIAGAGQLLSAFLGGRMRLPSLSGAASRRQRRRNADARRSPPGSCERVSCLKPSAAFRTCMGLLLTTVEKPPRRRRRERRAPSCNGWGEGSGNGLPGT